MVEILLSMCMLDEPANCRTERLTFAEESARLLSTPYGCMLTGQAEVQKHMVGKPKWRVAKWKCQAVREPLEARI